MSRFRFVGKNISGERVEGSIKAKNPRELESHLVERGIFLETFGAMDSDFSSRINGWMKKSEITHLTRQLAILIASGISVLEAVASIREQTKDGKLKAIFESIQSSLESGGALYEAFGRHPHYFDSLYLSLLKAGEISGTLDRSLERIADYREKSETVRKKFKASMAYPIFVLSVAIMAVLMMMVYIIPVFASMYSGFGIELPDLTVKIVSLGETLRSGELYTVIAVIMALVILVGLQPSEHIKSLAGRVVLSLPVIKGVFMKRAMAQFCRTAGTLITSGLPLIEAVEASVNTVGNKYMEKKLAALPSMLAEGISTSQSLFVTGVFPGTIIRMVAVGESTGQLGKMFSKAADYYEAEVDIETASLTAIIEPLIILVLGVIIGVILVAMYLPLLDLVGKIGG